MPLKLSVDDVDEVKFLDLRCVVLVDEELFNNRYFVIVKLYVHVSLQRLFKLLSGKSSVSVDVILVEQLRHVDVKLLDLCGQGLDDILNANPKHLLLDIPSKSLNKLILGHITASVVVKVLEETVYLVSLSLLVVKFNELFEVSNVHFSLSLVSAVVVKHALRGHFAAHYDVLDLLDHILSCKVD